MKIYSDKRYLAPNTPHTIMLCPFWGNNPEALESNARAYERYATQPQTAFQMVGLEDADIIVAPAAWEKNEATRQNIRQMAALASPQKPLVVFFWHDSDEPLELPNSVVFRTSLYKSTQKAHEYAMPSWSEDFIEGQLTLRRKQVRPVVGFCGYAMSRPHELRENLKDLGRLLKHGWPALQRQRRLRAHHVARARALRYLARNPQIETHFLLRDRFYGALADKQTSRREYIYNMINSDYTLCMRGAGNFSYRLYETLSAGRIPVFVDTDCVLPYDFLIDWKQYSVWLDINELDKIGDKVVDFHERLSEAEFVDLQRRCRQLWENYLSPEGFFKQFHRHFEG